MGCNGQRVGTKVSGMGFREKLEAAQRRSGSLLCVGLDPDPALMPVEDVAAFNMAILDAKRGDVGNTAGAYARALFERFGCDAVTVNAYGGYDTIEPFVAYADKGVFLWCR